MLSSAEHKTLPANKKQVTDSTVVFLFSLAEYYKYLSWVYGVDRKICHKDHWSASRGLPGDAE